MDERIDEKTFFNNLGFDDNPFRFTNADEEDRLEQYFIQPPYFESIFGDLSRPASAIVFAPRGGGKSAQRRMIEISSMGKPLLCLTYDRFEFPERQTPYTTTLEYHLRNILRIGVVGLLTHLQNDANLLQRYNKNDKRTLLALIHQYLGRITEDELKRAVDSLKSFPDKAKDFWNEYLPAIAPFLVIILKMLKMDPGELSRFEDRAGQLEQSPKYQLELLRNLAAKVGLKSIYVLVDKVDETALTVRDAKASFALISPLIKDLEVLEMKGFAFKFFLWDELEPFHREYARPDRIPQFPMEWDERTLYELLGERLKAYSNRKISRLAQVADNAVGAQIEELVISFSGNSPRDVIRICQRICNEQLEFNPFATKLQEKAVLDGISHFSEKRAEEIAGGNVLKDLKKVGATDFTLNFLANEIFKERHENTSRVKIKEWRNSGIVGEVGAVTGPRGKPVKLYAITDLRIARTLFPEMTVMEFFHKKVKRCERCGAMVIRDWDISTEHSCQECEHQFGGERPELPLRPMLRRRLRTKLRLPRGVEQLSLDLRETKEGNTNE